MEPSINDTNLDNVNDTFNVSTMWENEDQRQMRFKLNSSFGAWLVFMEMSLALAGIVLNMIVVISIREKESLMNNTVNVIIGNLCFSNLVAAVFVKSIAVVYHGYAIARSRWEIELAFCTVHTLTSRVTWAVFPYTLLVLCWHGLALRAGKIMTILNEAKKAKELNEDEAQQGYLLGASAVCDLSSVAKLSKQTSSEAESKKDSIEKVEAEEEDDEYDEFSEGLTSNQKCALGFVWFVSAIYSCMSRQILSKERDIHCNIRSDLTDKFNIISLFIAIAVPLVFGPIFFPIGHTILSSISCIKDTKDTGCCDQSNAWSDCGLITGFTIIFLIIYPVQMYITEEYLANGQSMFVFMAFKYCYGGLHIVLVPFLILIIKKDIRNAAVHTYIKTRPQEDGEITYEQFQKEVGFGVQPGV